MVNDALFGNKVQANDLSNLNIIRHKLLQFVKQFTAATPQQRVLLMYLYLATATAAP